MREEEGEGVGMVERLMREETREKWTIEEGGSEVYGGQGMCRQRCWRDQIKNNRK